jgi:hypothetical protein
MPELIAQNLTQIRSIDTLHYKAPMGGVVTLRGEQRQASDALCSRVSYIGVWGEKVIVLR